MENNEEQVTRKNDSDQVEPSNEAQSFGNRDFFDWDKDDSDLVDRIRNEETGDSIQEGFMDIRGLSALLKKVPWYVIALSVLAFAVILFAFISESRTTREARTPGARSKSEVQIEIENQDWIEQDLLPINRFSRPGLELEAVNGIVIHNIGNPDTTAVQNRNFFANLAMTEERHASSHFIICLDGAILQCTPVDEVAYASNERNIDTLSIEVCHPDDTGGFTNEAYISAVRLTAWLCVRFGLTSDDVIRHYDVQGKLCPQYFVENEGAWLTFKADVDRVIEFSSS